MLSQDPGHFQVIVLDGDVDWAKTEIGRPIYLGPPGQQQSHQLKVTRFRSAVENRDQKMIQLLVESGASETD